MEKYKLYNLLGDGTYGEVYKGINILTNELIAAKKLKHKIYSYNECLELPEVKALSKLNNCEYVIKLKEVIRDINSDVYLIFEYCEMNLYEYIEKIKHSQCYLSEICAKRIIYQILKGLEYIHTNSYIHRDLKPENILVCYKTNYNSTNNYTYNYNSASNKHSPNDNEVNIKIADFGLAKEINLSRKRLSSIERNDYFNNRNDYNRPMTDYVCTRWYRAPECILKSENYSTNIDIFALGCIYSEIINLKPIFPGTSHFDQLIKITNLISFPNVSEWPEGHKQLAKLNLSTAVLKHNKQNSTYNYNINRITTRDNFDKEFIHNRISEEGINCIKMMLTINPNNRKSASEILNTSYFKNNNYNHINNQMFNNFNRYTNRDSLQPTYIYKNEDIYKNSINLSNLENNMHNDNNNNVINRKFLSNKNCNIYNNNSNTNFPELNLDIIYNNNNNNNNNNNSKLLLNKHKSNYTYSDKCNDSILKNVYNYNNYDGYLNNCYNNGNIKNNSFNAMCALNGIENTQSSNQYFNKLNDNYNSSFKNILKNNNFGYIYN